MAHRRLPFQTVQRFLVNSTIRVVITTGDVRTLSLSEQETPSPLAAPAPPNPGTREPDFCPCGFASRDLSQKWSRTLWLPRETEAEGSRERSPQGAEGTGRPRPPSRAGAQEGLCGIQAAATGPEGQERTVGWVRGGLRPGRRDVSSLHLPDKCSPLPTPPRAHPELMLTSWGGGGGSLASRQNINITFEEKKNHSRLLCLGPPGCRGLRVRPGAAARSRVSCVDTCDRAWGYFHVSSALGLEQALADPTGSVSAASPQQRLGAPVLEWYWAAEPSGDGMFSMCCGSRATSQVCREWGGLVSCNQSN